jgi:hypothetical protein
MEIFRHKDSIYFRLGSWKGRSLPSRRSIVMFDRTNDHIGNEISQVAYCYQQSRILVNARKSELANWNPWCVIEDKVRENNDITLLLVSSKARARRLGNARDTNVNRLDQA